MTLASRITRLPRPFEPIPGAEARALFPALEGDVATLIEGAAGCSPYLRGLIHKEAEWLGPALNDPEAALEALIVALQAETGDPGTLLRQTKRRAALLIGLMDLGGAWTLEEITGALTTLADAACQSALCFAVGAEIKRGKLPGKTLEDAPTAAGMTVLAMGKMGAGELNYSSDIDLICLFDETQFNPDDYHDTRTSFVRATRRMCALLSENTAEGYVFRTDLRLRPDPGVTPVTMAMAAAETYYESLGRTWERAAYIKARPAAGDLEAGARFIDTLRPFVWRRHLDFAAIEDAHNMRLRIRAHKGLAGPVTLPGHNMKLGRGGIREIEFFTQTRQIIAGGRDPSLRSRGTVEGLAQLAAKEWIPVAVAEDLTEHYRFHREVEHRLQMLRDAQTHTLPTTQEEFDRLAAFMGRETDELKAEIADRLGAVDAVIERFFRPEDSPRGGDEDVPGIALDGGALDDTVLARWQGYPALRSDRAGQIFRRLRPDILARLKATSHPGEALVAFDAFLAGLPAGVQVFSLFEANPQLIDLMVDIAGTAPGLAAYLARNAAVFDAVIAGDFFAPWPGAASLAEALTMRLKAEQDYEHRLDTARRWRREWHFRIGVHLLRGVIDAGQAGQQYADLAEAVLVALWPVVGAHFAEKHGEAPGQGTGRGAALIAMGSLGVAQLNAGSDLDLIVIYDAGGVEASEGRRPLPARTYYARLTQAMITALTAPMAEGWLYEVDMRLRPSGNQGPVATGWQAFQDYQREQAWVWEHLALTRARVIAGPVALSAEIEAFRLELLSQPAAPEHVLKEVSEMRARIAAAKAPAGLFDPKLGPGRLQDIELVAQAASLMAQTAEHSAERSIEGGLAAGVAIGWLEDADEVALRRAAGLCAAMVQVLRLLGPDTPMPDEIGAGARALLLRETGQESMGALETALDEATAQAATIITAALARVPRKP